MEVLKERYTITELSEQLNTTDHALRYYEKEFQLEVPKDDRGRRYYTPELANILYQIRNMRNDGLEIKAIKKILQSENLIGTPPPVVVEDTVTTAITPLPAMSPADIRQFFEDFKQQLTSSVCTEITNSRDQLSRELGKTKLELGACVENSMRRLENKLDKHFQDVDRSLSNWREKSRKNFFMKLLSK